MPRIFVETQRFRSVWVYLIIALLGGLVAWGIVQQVILGVPFGNNPAPDWFLLVMGLLPLALVWLFRRTILSTKIDQTGIHYRFAPFLNKWKVKNWKEIQKAEIVTYKPLRDYGGWGIRYGLKGKAYNVAGNQGLSIQLKNGKKLLLGTQKADEMKQFLVDLKTS